MFRISKLTDYAIVIAAHFARSGQGTLLSARDVGQATLVPLPTASKVLKTLSRQGILASSRGKGGGYHLVSPPEATSVASIIEAMEGPLALTECSTPGTVSCSDHSTCPIRDHWIPINLAVRTALDAITLVDLIRPIGGIAATESVLDASHTS